MVIMRRYMRLLISAYIIFLSHPAYAEFEKAKTTLTSIADGLRGLSLVTVTIAILWVGYKVLFGGNTLQECSHIITGAVIIAGSAEFAKLLVGYL